jgi:hypothetical protein
MTREMVSTADILDAQETALDKRLQEFMDIAQFQADNVLPQNNADPYTASFEVTFAAFLRTNTDFRAIYRDILADDCDGKPLRPEDLIRQNLKTFQFIETMREPRVFPFNRGTPESWEEPMRQLLYDDDYREQFFLHIYRPVASNVSERGAGLELVSGLHERSGPQSVLDLGASLGHVLRRIPLQDDLDMQFRDIAVMRRVPGTRSEPHCDQEATRSLNRWRHTTRVVLGPSLGADLVEYDKDTSMRARAISDSRYLGELALDNVNRTFDILEHTVPVQLEFRGGINAADFTLDDLGHDAFDMTYLSTMLYQSSPEDRKQILYNAEAATATNGLVIVQDFIRQIRRNGASQVYKRWPNFTYGIWVKDMQNPRLGYQKYFSVYGGRIGKVIPEPAINRFAAAHRIGITVPDPRSTA